MAEYYKEGFLIQVILYAIIWLVSEYAGMLVCVIMFGVLTGLLILSLLTELVQRSKVPASYFKWMALSALAPLVVAVGFSMIYGGNFDWLRE